MIQIKNKVNKTELFKELTEFGKKRFEFTCEPEEDLKVFLDGAETLFKLLRLPVVVDTLPNIDSNEFKKWLKDEGYQRTNIKKYLKRNNANYNTENVYRHFCNVIEFGN